MPFNPIAFVSNILISTPIVTMCVAISKYMEKLNAILCVAGISNDNAQSH